MPRHGKRRLVTALLLLAACSVTAQTKTGAGPSSSITPSTPMCQSSDLSLALDRENGNFDGMSQSGTLVVLRNLSAAACRVEAFPQIVFSAGDTVLDLKPEVAGARFLHPGPVVLPVLIVPGAELTATLHWVAGPVFPQNVCVKPSTIALKIEGEMQQTSFGSQICGDKLKGITYQMTRFAPDPAAAHP